MMKARLKEFLNRGAKIFTRSKSRGAKIVLKHFYFDTSVA